MKAYRIKHEVRSEEIRDPKAYDEVLALRREAYAASGKSVPPMSFDELRALGDAKVIGFFRQSRLVASFLIRFPAAGARLESVDVPLGRYPAGLPPKSDSVEVTKLCVHQDFRRTDLLKAIFEQVHRELVLSRRSSIVICCEPRLRRLYRAIGFRRTGYRFGHFEILVTTQKRFGLYGAHVGPVKWNLFLGEITRKMLERGELSPRPLTLAFWSLYGMFGPLAVVLENRRVK